MSFSSFEFLFYFCPCFLGLFYLIHKQYRTKLTVAGSFLFYLWGSPAGATILLLTTVVDYYLAEVIFASKNRMRKWVLFLGIFENIALLFYFKYMNFFVGEFNTLFGYYQIPAIPWTSVVFPLGISFITFHKISYLVDIHRQKATPADTFLDFALYMVFFPKLIQGPIICYHEFSSPAADGKATDRDRLNGLFRFCIGLAKKTLIADPLGTVADKVFGLDLTAMTVGYSWLGALCYTLQIYFDFSGYSDMAIGIGNMMGFKISENFNRPYISQNFTEFWRRWHMTLSNWFKHYLYIPLGGNRRSSFRMYFNLWIVFLLSGLWHGANWTFIVWGAYHGLFLVANKLFWIKASHRLGKMITIPLTFFFVLIGWVIFRSDSIGFAGLYLGRMFDIARINSMVTDVPWVDLVGNRQLFVMCIALFISFFPNPLFEFIKKKLNCYGNQNFRIWMALLWTQILLWLSLIHLANKSFKPFIYLRF